MGAGACLSGARLLSGFWLTVHVVSKRSCRHSRTNRRIVGRTRRHAVPWKIRPTLRHTVQCDGESSAIGNPDLGSVSELIDESEIEDFGANLIKIEVLHPPFEMICVVQEVV